MLEISFMEASRRNWLAKYSPLSFSSYHCCQPSLLSNIPTLLPLTGYGNAHPVSSSSKTMKLFAHHIHVLSLFPFLFLALSLVILYVSIYLSIFLFCPTHSLRLQLHLSIILIIKFFSFALHSPFHNFISISNRFTCQLEVSQIYILLIKILLIDSQS